MGVAQEIDKLEKDFAAAIKKLETERTSVLAVATPLRKGEKALTGNVKKVLEQLVNAIHLAESVETGYDGYIEALKSYAKEFPAWKKKNAEAEAFYKDLLAEKKEKDSARKKAGKDYKPSKADEIFDAVFKKATDAYEASKVCDAMEDQMKAVDSVIDQYCKSGDYYADTLSDSMTKYDSMMADFTSFKINLPRLSEPGGKPDPSVLSKEFEAYFSRFKGR